MEGLYLSGVYRRCEDEIMHYYIQTDATGEDYTDFRRLMLTVEDLLPYYETAREREKSIQRFLRDFSLADE